MTWHKSIRTWIAILAATSALVLGVVSYSLQRDLGRMRAKSDKFDDYCNYVRTEVSWVEYVLRMPVDPNERNLERDKYVEAYFNVRDFGSRRRVDVEWCAATPIDFHAIDERFRRCTSDKFTCLADSFAEVKQHIPRTFK